MKKIKVNRILVIVLAFVFMLGLGGIIAVRAYNYTTPVVLGTAGNFAVLAGAGITDVPTSAIIGDAGSDPTVSNGLPNGEVTGTNYTANDAAVEAAKVALSTAYADVSTRAQSGADIGTNLGTQNLSPGVYHAASGTFGITAGQTLTLDGGGNPNSIFIFKTDTTLVTGDASSVVLTNGAQACNVFWAVGSAATLNNTTFVGTIMANSEAITDSGDSTINGRLLARTAAVTLNHTHVTVPTCAPHLTLVKTIDNTGGGLASATDWTLTATGTVAPTNLSGFTGTTNVDSDLKFTDATFKADTYTLDETGPAGYTASLYSCVKNGAGAVLSNSIILIRGDEATCTITNTYIVPPATATLTLEKTITNNNGGARAVADFPLTATGTTTITGISGAGTITNAVVTAGLYTLSETTHADYTQGIWSCTNGIIVTASQITLGSGDTTTCTINNNDNAPILHLRKVVNGGTKTVADFPLTANGTGANDISGTSPVDSGAGLLADTFALSETNPGGYTSSAWVCVGGTQVGSNITLAINEEATCTIINTFIPPSGGGGSHPQVPPLIDVVKIPSPLALPSGPGPVTYTYTLRNTGTVPVTNITMVDDTCSPLIFLSGDLNKDTNLDLNEIWTYDCFETLSATHTNIVTTIGWANGISATDIATATVVVGASVVPPLIHITKVPSPLALIGAGMVTYTYTVTNPGTEPLSNVSIVDDKCTGLPGRVLGHPGDINKNNLLESNETWSFTCQSKLTKTTINTATASGSANGLTAKDFAIATVVVSSPGLPKTGFSDQEKDIIIPITLFSIFSVFSIFLYFVQRKQTI